MKTNVLKMPTIVLMLSVAMAITGCNKANETVSKIDSEIVIAMKESSLRTLQLCFSTTKIYPCCNYPIDLSWKQSSNIIEISLKGVIETDFCLTALGPATAVIDLGTLNDGIYYLNFHNGIMKQSGRLIVSSGSYEANFQRNPIFHFMYTSLNKIPENTIWVVTAYNEEKILSSFLESLMNLGATKKLYSHGYYSINVVYPYSYYQFFKIEKDGSIIYSPKEITNTIVDWGGKFMQSFVFQYFGNIANIEQLVKQYKEQMEIQVYTDKGEQFTSW
jgi:hypothetical protein